jgi:hypothetical protein
MDYNNLVQPKSSRAGEGAASETEKVLKFDNDNRICSHVSRIRRTFGVPRAIELRSGEEVRQVEGLTSWVSRKERIFTQPTSQAATEYQVPRTQTHFFEDVFRAPCY